MSIFKLPDWHKNHMYEGKTFSQLSGQEVNDLKKRLEKFSSKHPDVSVVIPAYNEEKNLHRTLSSISANTTKYNVQLIVINNNSTDKTQEILDCLGIESYFQPLQGIAYARTLGLEEAKGKYHLCADADTIYPPSWIDTMVAPMISNKKIVGVYGRYSFLPSDGKKLLSLSIYEALTGILFRLRKNRREHINVLGFNMGFVTEIGREKQGFKVKEVRKFDNAVDSIDYTEVSEDGNMAVHLLSVGQLKMITSSHARVLTSTRKLYQNGSLWSAFQTRIIKNLKGVTKSMFTPKQKLLSRDRESVLKNQS